MKRKMVVAAMVAALCAAGLAGCSSNDEVIVKKPAKEQAFPSLTQKQIKDVFASLGKTLGQADKERNADKLAARVEDPALAMRKGQYAIAKASDSAIDPMPIANGTVTITSTTTWPRVLVNMASAGADKPTYVEAIRQDDARSQFKLWQWVRLFPKQTVPQTAVSSKGAPVIEPNSKKLAMTPKAAVEKYAASLKSAEDLTKAGFADDPLAQSIRKTGSAFSEELKDKYSVDHKVEASKDFMAIGLENGGALVFAQFDEKLDIKREDSNATLKLKGDIAAMLGDDGKADAGANMAYKVIALMVVPKAGSKDPVKVIGAEHVLVSASKAE